MKIREKNVFIHSSYGESMVFGPFIISSKNHNVSNAISYTVFSNTSSKYISIKNLKNH